jgi:hypothetical protein
MRKTTWAGARSALAAACLVACSSDADTLAGRDGAEGGTPSTPVLLGRGTPTANPYGVAYPTENLGWVARGAAVQGNIIANLPLKGSAPGSSAIEMVHLSTFLDPEKRTHELLLIVAAEPKNPPAEELFAALEKEPVNGLVTLAVVGRAGGSPATRPATEADLAPVREAHPGVWVLLDPDYAAFGAAFDTTASPWIAMVDTRNMEIVASGVGGVTVSTVVQQRDAARLRTP